MKLMAGVFYEFHSEIVVTRPGAEIAKQKADTFALRKDGSIASKNEKGTTTHKSNIQVEGKRYHEIQKQIERSKALERVATGLDVYTPNKADAKQLGKDAFAGWVKFDTPHSPYFFPHFQPEEKGSVDIRSSLEGKTTSGHSPRRRQGGGHIFFGSRGEGWTPKGAVFHEQMGIPESEEVLHK